MHHALIREVTDVTEFRLALQALPPAIVHGTVIILTALLGAALVWLAATPADLVVRAPGRVRPVTSPLKVVMGSSGEVAGGSSSGRVVAVHVREGETVRQGDGLIQLDTERLDNDIAKRRRTLQASEEEFARLQEQETLLERQFASAQAKSAAELSQARREIRQAQDRMTADVNVAELELTNAEYEEVQTRRLVERGVVAQDTLRKVTARVREAQEKLRKIRLPVEQGRVEVLRRALELTEREYAVRRQELQTKQGLKQGEMAALRLELVNLTLERQQALIRAPSDGLVIAGDVKVGEFLTYGKTVVELAAQQGFRFEVAVPSEEVSHLQVGMPARVKLDSYDYQRYGTAAGTVVFIAPDSGVSSGQPTAVYLVKIQLTGEELGMGNYRGRIKLGMTGQAEIVTGQERLLALLVKKIRQTISLG
jgi:RTX toxin transport system membrane fusion protein